MIKCQSCGTDNAGDSKFCTGCGVNLTPAEAGEMKCAGCGAAVPADSKFCVNCGQPVAASASTRSAHCTSCGAKLEPGSGFCTECGASQAASVARAGGAPAPGAGDMEAVLAAYWAGFDARLVQSGFEAVGQPVGLDSDRLFKRQRFDLAKAGKVTTMCAAKWVPSMTAEAVRLYSQTVFNFASAQKGLLARSSFQPLVVYPVLVTAACPPEIQAFLNSHWPKRLMAYEFPVVVALSSKELFCHRSTPVWGMAFHAGFVREAGLLFQP